MKPADILVVEDEARLRFFLRELLTREGHEVVTVESGESALIFLEDTEFDLALIDLKLRGMGGLEFLAALRRRAPDTVAIMLTGYASLETAVEALRHGACDYLFKPCKSDELCRSVGHALARRQELLRRRDWLRQYGGEREDFSAAASDEAGEATPSSSLEPSSDPPNSLTSGGLVVDRERHEIVLWGQRLDLSPTEFELLGYLYRASPRVVSAQELVREVQGYKNDIKEAHGIVRYHIYRMRRKVKASAGCVNLIRTVRGIGYAVNVDEVA
jgi:DNA-binding response OmpR family regulator